MIEKVILQTSDNKRIVADHYKAKKGSPSILLIHMMPSDRKSYTKFAEKLFEKGIGVLAIDLRGHGESEQGPEGYKSFSDEQHQSSILDVKAGLNFQKDEGHSPMFICGASIGANLALQALTEENVKKIILLSPGINYKGIKTLELASKIPDEKAVFILACKADLRSLGSADEQALKIYEALNCNKKIRIFDVGGHGTNILEANPKIMDELISWIQKF